ncbi:MAG TPA: hypothetical protein VFC24_12100 [Casimicrobiaceae bacterium]|nr:hypothetical protein [Casimicrobiaceae bacterium]
MESAASVTLLYQTLDSLVALKLDLMLAEHHGASLPEDRRQRMSSDIDQSIANIRGVIQRLESRGELARSTSASELDAPVQRQLPPTDPQLTAKQ